MPAANWDEPSDSFDDREYPDEDDLDDGSTDTVVCPHCGADVYEDADQCPECGMYSAMQTPASGRANPSGGSPWDCWASSPQSWRWFSASESPRHNLARAESYANVSSADKINVEPFRDFSGGQSGGGRPRSRLWAPASHLDSSGPPPPSLEPSTGRSLPLQAGSVQAAC